MDEQFGVYARLHCAAKVMDLFIKNGTDFASVFERARKAAPEAFDTSSLRNLIGGEWVSLGHQQPHKTPVDQSSIVGPTMRRSKC